MPVLYLTVSDSFRTALELFKKNTQFLIWVTLIAWATYGIIDALGNFIGILDWFPYSSLYNTVFHTNPMLLRAVGIYSSVASFMAFFVWSFLTMNQIKIYLRIYDGQVVTYTDLFSDLNRFVNFLVGYVLLLLIIVGGCILLIFPGVIWGLKYGFTPYLIVDKGIAPMSALRKSAEITAGHKGELFLIFLTIVGIRVVGLLVFCVGLLAAYPLGDMMWVDCYRKLVPVEMAKEDGDF